MTKLHEGVRPRRTGSLGVECLEGRALLSGASHAATTGGTALLPPAMIRSYLQRSGDEVTGLVMVFSKPLDPATAQDVNTYQVSRTVSLPTRELPRVAVDASAAVYNPGQNSVTLVLAEPLKLSTAPKTDTFLVGLAPGSTITDTSGNSLVYSRTLLLGGKPVLLTPNVAEIVARGPSPGPLFHTFDPSQIQKILAKNATPRSIAAASAARTDLDATATAVAASDAAYQAQQAAVAAAFAAGPRIPLSGTIQGTYSTSRSHFHEFGGEVYVLDVSMTGTGSIAPMGQATENASSGPWDLHRGAPNEQFKTDQGWLGLTFNLHPVGTHRAEGTYSFQGVNGGGPNQWATGSGNVVVTWTGDHTSGRYTEVFS